MGQVLCIVKSVRLLSLSSLNSNQTALILLYMTDIYLEYLVILTIRRRREIDAPFSVLQVKKHIAGCVSTLCL